MFASTVDSLIRVLLVALLIDGVIGGPAAAEPVVPSAAGGDEQLWVARFEPADTPYAAAVSPDGARVYVTGFSQTTVYDYVTLAYDATTGRQIWVARYQGADDSWDIAHAIAVSPDGRMVYVTGLSGPYWDYDYVTVAYDAASGHQLWTATYNGPGDGEDQACCIRVSPDGLRVFVTGFGVGQDLTYDYATVAYEAISGKELWAAQYSGHHGRWDAATSLVSSPAGDKVYVTGASQGRTIHADFATVAYDATTGVQVWAARSNTSAGWSGIPHSLDVAPDGSSVFVTGCRSSDDNLFVCIGDSDFATFSYDAARGGQRWEARFDGPAHGDDNAFSVRVDPRGAKVYVTGYSEGVTNYFFATLAYDIAKGTRVWSAVDNGPREIADIPCCLAVTPDGSKVVVSGYEYRSGKPFTDMVTASYDATTGRRQWTARYDGPSHGYDVTNSMVVSPDSRVVYVTGGSEGAGPGYDFATIAYAA